MYKNLKNICISTLGIICLFSCNDNINNIEIINQENISEGAYKDIIPYKSCYRIKTTTTHNKDSTFNSKEESLKNKSNTHKDTDKNNTNYKDSIFIVLD